MSFFLAKQLPVLPPAAYTPDLLDFIVPRVLELTYTAWDLQPFARDVGYDGPPFIWDEERRFLLRCELDALYFHLYGIARDDVDYIMETFPIVKRKDEKQFGEYRTRRVILEMYDQMAEALTPGPSPSGRGEISGYQTRLSPGPADPGMAHPERPGPCRMKAQAIREALPYAAAAMRVRSLPFRNKGENRMIPTQNDFLPPFLQILSDGKDHTRAQIMLRLVKHFDINQDEAQAMSGPQFTLVNRVAWCDVHFCKAGFVHKTQHPHDSMQDTFRITSLGVRELNRHPEQITVGYLMSFYRGGVLRRAGADDTTSEAELLLSERFESLPDVFTVFHSVKCSPKGLAASARQTSSSHTRSMASW